MPNFNCDLCKGRTGITYANDKFTTITRNHFMILGNVICEPCANEIKDKIFSVKTNRIKGKIINKIILKSFTWIKGNHIEN